MKTIAFIAALGFLTLGAFYLSYAAPRLPAADGKESISLRNVQQRRSHFHHYYARGK